MIETLRRWTGQGQRTHRSRSSRPIAKRPAGVTFLASVYFCAAALLAWVCLAMMVRGPDNTPGNPQAWVFIDFFLLVPGSLLIGTCVMLALVGYGLWRMKNWARVVTIVLCALIMAAVALSYRSNLQHLHSFLSIAQFGKSWAGAGLCVDALAICYLLRRGIRGRFTRQALPTRSET